MSYYDMALFCLSFICLIMRIAIIGAGAAGCFCAVNVKRLMPSAEVEVLEAGSRPLAKVAITGGGRCNLTNSFVEVRSEKEVYPRGDKLMKRLFCQFDHADVMEWFEREGVRLVVQDDQCVFPRSQNAMEIVDTLVRLMHRSGVKLHVGCRVESVEPDGGQYRIIARDNYNKCHDVVVVTTGGSPKMTGVGFLSPLQLEMIPPVPSLFTFNIPDNPITQLMGVVVTDAGVSLAGTKFKAQGPLLVTHWGVSGPAVLRLSSYAARHLAECGYDARLLVNWMGEDGCEQTVTECLLGFATKNPQKQVSSVYPQALTSRLWQFLLSRCGISPETRWSELSKKSRNKLVAALVADEYHIKGQSRFKEEFVTCGGVALSNINLNTLECKHHPNLYFAGEVLDVDAVTGGFNLQAAWTMGYVVAKSIAAIS